MDIVPGASGEKAKAAAVAGFLERVLHPGNGPYAVIIWTRHPDVRAAFEEAIFRSEELPRPVAIEMVEKHEFDRGPDGFDIVGLSARLAVVLANARPLQFFKIWEEACSASAVKVTNLLSRLADSKADVLAAHAEGWKSMSLRLMQAIARASAEKQLTQERCAEALFAALNPLHADKMEQVAVRRAGLLREFAAEVLGAEGDCTQEHRSRINGLLHVALPVDERLVAGGIYTTADPGGRLSAVLEDLVQTGKDEKQHKEWVAEVRGDCRFIMVEVSPVCDHAQENVRFARFVTGVLIPEARLTRFKGGKFDGEPKFFWSFGPIYLDGAGIPAGEHHIILSARHPEQFRAVAGQDMREFGLATVGRLRGQVLAALQTWVAGQATRPGMLFLHEKR
jgi:hypothetical protein